MQRMQRFFIKSIKERKEHNILFIKNAKERENAHSFEKNGCPLPNPAMSLPHWDLLGIFLYLFARFNMYRLFVLYLFSSSYIQ